MLPTLPIGPLSLPVPGLLLILGLWVGLSLSERSSARFNINSEKLYNLVLLMMVFGILGARIGFIALHPEGYLAKPLDMLALNLSAADPLSGAALALIVGLIYTSRNHLGLKSTIDALTPLAATMAIFFHLANFASGSGFGSPTDLPWALNLWGAYRHPVQMYEAIAAAMIFAALWFYLIPQKGNPPGRIFLLFLAMTSGARLFLEAFHGDSVLIGSVRLVQVLSWGILAIALFSLPRDKQVENQD